MPEIPTRFYALCVVRHQGRYLLVHERKHGQSWYLPAGQVEPGETIPDAARREAREESGVEVELLGVLRIEHAPEVDGAARLRVFFLARPAGDPSPKSHADAHSLEARWFTPGEALALPLRGDEVPELLRAVEAGAPVHPLGVLVSRFTPFAAGPR